MKRNDPVTITPCANGFIVEPFCGQNLTSPNHRVMVFDAHDDLMRFLDSHFDGPESWKDIYEEPRIIDR